MAYKLATHKFCISKGGGSSTTPTKLVKKSELGNFYCKLITNSPSATYADNRAVREADITSKYVTDKVLFYFVKNGQIGRTYYNGQISSGTGGTGALYGQTIVYTSSASFTFGGTNCKLGVGELKSYSGNTWYFNPITASIYSGTISTAFNFALGSGGSTLYYKSGTSSGTTIARTQGSSHSIKTYYGSGSWDSTNGRYTVNTSSSSSVSLTVYEYTWSWNTVLANIENANVITFGGAKYYQVAILV